jgi:D-alanyl-lipoteichoic acid acyltransferase DltB (MBOAT superfamily)
MWITMLISGLWHGAAWHFIIWAVVHSFYLSIERITSWPGKLARLPAGKHLATTSVFLLTVLAWVFFRAETFSQAVEILGLMFNVGSFNFAAVDNMIDNNALNVLAVIIGSQLFFYFGMDKAPWATSTSRVKAAVDTVFIAFLILMCVFMRAPSSTFIYFQF